MILDDDGRYAALRARDPRFDGLFFVAVRTTGIYCRPICPARLPARENCTFYRTAAEAESHGYRPCLRCRPELAPGHATVDAGSRLTRAAVERIDAGYLNDHGVDDLAASLDVSARHLRRVLRSELGVTPVQLAQTRRLAVAKQLLQDTSMPVTRVAFAAGFSSVRRFNAVFAERFSRPPSAIRRGRPAPGAGAGGATEASAAAESAVGPAGASADGRRGIAGGDRVRRDAARRTDGRRQDRDAGRVADGDPQGRAAEGREGERISVRLDYRPPLAWRPLLDFLARRAVPGVEAVEGDSYRRFVAPGHGGEPGERAEGEAAAGPRPRKGPGSTDGHGWVEVVPLRDRSSLRASIPIALVSRLPAVVAGLRRLLDLDARPDVIASHLRDDPRIGPLVEERPGLRVPGAYDPFELAVRTVLGQQISVEAASALCGRLVERFGYDVPGVAGSDEAPSEGAGPGGRIFPPPERLAARTVDEIRELGMPRSRARTVVELSRAVAHDGLRLDETTDPEAAAERLRSIYGIGPWTSQYLLMRAARWPNAFPASDLGIRKALGGVTAAEAEARSRTWEPWRAYAALHLWNDPSDGESR